MVYVLETRCPMAMMAVGIARPVEARMTRIYHSLAVLGNVSVPAIRAVRISIARSIGIRRRRCISICYLLVRRLEAVHHLRPMV